jgi:hypothetical protein
LSYTPNDLDIVGGAEENAYAIYYAVGKNQALLRLFQPINLNPLIRNNKALELNVQKIHQIVHFKGVIYENTHFNRSKIKF